MCTSLRERLDRVETTTRRMLKQTKIFHARLLKLLKKIEWLLSSSGSLESMRKKHSTIRDWRRKKFVWNVLSHSLPCSDGASAHMKNGNGVCTRWFRGGYIAHELDSMSSGRSLCIFKMISAVKCGPWLDSPETISREIARSRNATAAAAVFESKLDCSFVFFS